jgi:hypothetical protein
MVKSDHVRSEQVQTSIDSQGTMRTRLIIGTNLPVGTSVELDELASKIVDFLRTNSDFDGADVLHIKTTN